MASDVNQLVDIFGGKHDIGAINLMPQISAPSNTLTATTSSGGGMGTGVYQYSVTYCTGYKQSNGVLQITGETTGSPSFSVTTPSGNGTVGLNAIPVYGGNAVVARRIYRTAVGGSTLYLVATISDNVTQTYTDSASDASITSGAGIPSANQTGTYFMQDMIIRKSVPQVQLDASRGTFTGLSYNASSTSDFGLNIKVANNNVLKLSSTGATTTFGGSTLDDSLGNATIKGTLKSDNTYLVWNDNYVKRTFVLQHLSTAQVVSTLNAWVKVGFQTIDRDLLSECPAGYSQFKAKNAGTYSISSSLFVSTPAVNTLVYIGFFKNGSLICRSNGVVSSSTQTYNLPVFGHCELELAVNDIIEVYVYTSASVTLAADNLGSIFTVGRLT
jgi:hypothetical protein